MGKYHHGDLRNALVCAALARVEADGAAAFSLREAARDVGVSANAAYRHFEDKGALLVAVATEGFEALSHELQRALSATDAPGEQVKAVGRAYVAFALSRPHLFHLMFTDRGASCLDVEAVMVGPTPGQLLSQALAALADAGEIAPARQADAAMDAWALAHGFATLALSGPPTLRDPLVRERAFEGILDFLLAGLRSP